MKKSSPIFALLLMFCFFLAISFTSCRTKCNESRTYVGLVPVYESLKDIRTSFKVLPPQNLENPGKIHVLGNTLFIVETGKGIHVVDNSSINQPFFTSFIQLHGCTDLSSSNGVLQANQGPDLVSINITSLNDISLVNRISNVVFADLIKADSFIIDYVEREIIELREDGDCGGSRWGFGIQEDAAVMSANGMGGTGTSGSMARLAIYDNFLYVVDNTSISSYSLANSERPVFSSRQNFGVGFETIYITNNMMYIGTTMGMNIYKIVEGKFQFNSSFQHARGCDPVVVNNDIAYVTLRGNGRCGQASNSLSVVDVSNSKVPKLLAVHSMNEPYGLAINDDVLVICDGESGMRLFDPKESEFILQNELSKVTGMKTYDVIMMGTHVILTSDAGIFQYDISDPRSPIQKSVLFSK